MSFHQILLTQKYHCNQNAVIGSQLHCPYMKNVRILSVLCQRNDNAGIIDRASMYKDTAELMLKLSAAYCDCFGRIFFRSFALPHAYGLERHIELP